MIKEYIKYIKDNPKNYWFKAKLFGWGWTPAKWQGWLVLLVFFILIIFNAYRIESFSNSTSDAPIKLIFQTIVLFFLLFVICWKTGEKPRWQWGKPRPEKKN